MVFPFHVLDSLQLLRVSPSSSLVIRSCSSLASFTPLMAPKRNQEHGGACKKSPDYRKEDQRGHAVCSPFSSEAQKSLSPQSGEPRPGSPPAPTTKPPTRERREGEEGESRVDVEECPRRREGSLGQGREETEATATNAREDSALPTGLLKDHSLGASRRKFG